ncbi:hypothetical protein [Baileyella intestinalis]|uniref:hypothetical protein n=1 Tax=Baileyella intestinalis TaxID=2606709 RepID=UPI0022E35320|nr:hypothetical protein [Baileyella intestinalis]
MKEKMYFNDNEVIMNFDLTYPETKTDLLKSREFRRFLEQYMQYLATKNRKLYDWARAGMSEKKAIDALSRFARALIVFDYKEINDQFTYDPETALEFVERCYDFWKTHERYSITTDRRRDAQSTFFVTADDHYNNLVLSTFRRIEQTLMGRANKIYRQQPAGTNAGLALYRNDSFTLGDNYDALRKVMFIDAVMLRTPMILHPKSNKREWAFEEVETNPIYSFKGNSEDYFCFPAKVGDLMIFIYFHRDFMSSGVSCANLFELATKKETVGKPDCILIFGNDDGLNKCTFYHDDDMDLWVGSVTYNEKIDYFGYMKKTVLTLHNVAMMAKGWLPIHGAFVNITLNDDRSKGICLMGDSGAGKSETIETLKNLGNDKIKNIEVVFDDMGTFHIENGQVYAKGTEIGAFVRLDDLDPGTPYRDMNRSIFFNPDRPNARVITPAAPYSVVTTNHKVDLFAYANNYGDGFGLRRIEDLEEAKGIFIEGKRMAKGTTQEQGLSKTFFANPFGPMQQQDLCGGIIDQVFNCLKANGVFVGEVFTHLGVDPENSEGLDRAAQDLLSFIEEE